MNVDTRVELKGYYLYYPLISKMKEIKLNQGKIALVDDEDFEWLSQWKWGYSRGYAIRGFLLGGKRFNVSMHNQILRQHKILNGTSKQTDHINKDRLDNRKANLRVASIRENSLNRGLRRSNKSGFKGVHWNKPLNKWRAQIKVGEKQLSLGVFLNKEEAAKAYNDAAKQYFGEFAHLNQI